MASLLLFIPDIRCCHFITKGPPIFYVAKNQLLKDRVFHIELNREKVLRNIKFYFEKYVSFVKEFLLNFGNPANTNKVTQMISSVLTQTQANLS